MPAFTERGGGRIVNVVTELWNMAPAGWSVYLAGKGAMVGMSRSLAAELGPQGVTVNMVAPGWMATDKVDTSSEGSRGFAASLPLRRHGGRRGDRARLRVLPQRTRDLRDRCLPAGHGRAGDADGSVRM